MGYHKLKAYGGKGGGGLWDFKAEVAPGQGYGEMRNANTNQTRQEQNGSKSTDLSCIIITLIK